MLKSTRKNIFLGFITSDIDNFSRTYRKQKEPIENEKNGMRLEKSSVIEGDLKTEIIVHKLKFLLKNNPKLLNINETLMKKNFLEALGLPARVMYLNSINYKNKDYDISEKLKSVLKNTKKSCLELITGSSGCGKSLLLQTLFVNIVNDLDSREPVIFFLDFINGGSLASRFDEINRVLDSAIDLKTYRKEIRIIIDKTGANR